MPMRDVAEPMLASTASEPSIETSSVAGGLAVPRLVSQRRASGRTTQVAEELGEAETARTGSWVGIVLAAGLIVALLLRIAASEQLSSHVDEAASVLAVQMTAEKGAPIFPSGTLYLQGATVS